MTSISGFQPLGSSGLLSLDSIADKNCSYRDIALTYQVISRWCFCDVRMSVCVRDGYAVSP